MIGVSSPMLLSFLALSFAVVPVAANVLVDGHQDRVKSLPGYDAPLPSRWYSGFLDYELEGQQIHTHYILVEAERESVSITPTPLIYWSNGGPGASSMFGLLTELGPLILSDDSIKTDAYRDTGLPTLFYNTRSWTRLGHILVFDAPAPVGYSYCNSDEQPDHDHNSTNHKKECISWTDELSSQNAYLALQTFFQDKFPVLQQTPLYLTGESYAGIYIPTLARRIVENQDDFAINLKGFAVGDGCLGTETGICGSLSSNSRFDYWLVLFLAGHGQIPLSTFTNILQVCTTTTTATTDQHHHHESSRRLGISTNADAIDKDACQEALDTLEAQVGGYYEYALYDECGARNGLMSSSSAFLSGAENDYPCGGGVVMEDYVKLSQVKEALHVANGTFFSVDNADNFDYTPTEKDISGFYKSQVGKLKMLVYNGDTDPAITSFAAQNWTSNLGLDVTEDWRPWTLDGCKRVGGYVTRYEGGLDFLTIRGAGHLVPTYKPDAAFSFMKHWIDGKEYPRFDKSCVPHSGDKLVQVNARQINFNEHVVSTSEKQA